MVAVLGAALALRDPHLQTGERVPFTGRAEDKRKRGHGYSTGPEHRVHSLNLGEENKQQQRERPRFGHPDWAMESFLLGGLVEAGL